MLAAWNRIPFKKVSRCSLLPPGSTKRHCWRLLGLTCTVRVVFLIMFTEWIFHFPGENLQNYDQVSSRVTQAGGLVLYMDKQFCDLCHTDSCCLAQCRCLPNDHWWGIPFYISPRIWLELWESDNPHFLIHTLLLLTLTFPDTGKEHWPDWDPVDGTLPRSGLLETIIDKIL